MTKHIVRLTAAVAFVLALALPAAALAVPQQQISENTELFAISNVSLESAVTLARSVCYDALQRWDQSPDSDRERGTDRPRCDVSPLDRENMLAVTASPELRQRIAALLSEFDRLPQTRSFHIMVLAASRTGTGVADVPDAVRAALDDVSEFLPYTSFSTLGSGWLRTSQHGETTLPGGPMEFNAELMFRASTDPTAPVLIEHFSISRRVLVEEIVDGVTTQQYQSRGMLQTTFTISPGETVVVGTSKLNGDDEAVVVLLTAVRN